MWEVDVRGGRNEYVGFPVESEKEDVKWLRQGGGRKKGNQEYGGGCSHLRLESKE